MLLSEDVSLTMRKRLICVLHYLERGHQGKNMVHPIAVVNMQIWHTIFIFKYSGLGAAVGDQGTRLASQR